MSPRKKTSEPIRIGIDTGGTFTDFVAARGSRLLSFKAPSTPHNPAEAILSGIARILADAETLPFEIVHGTTVATNALLERKGGRTGIIATEGFRDVLEMRRRDRPHPSPAGSQSPIMKASAGSGRMVCDDLTTKQEGETCAQSGVRRCQAGELLQMIQCAGGWPSTAMVAHGAETPDAQRRGGWNPCLRATL